MKENLGFFMEAICRLTIFVLLGVTVWDFYSSIVQYFMTVNGPRYLWNSNFKSANDALFGSIYAGTAFTIAYTLFDIRMRLISKPDDAWKLAKAQMLQTQHELDILKQRLGG